MVLKELPPLRDGLTAKGVTPTVTEGQTQHLANRRFAIDDPNGVMLTVWVELGMIRRQVLLNPLHGPRGKPLMGARVTSA